MASFRNIRPRIAVIGVGGAGGNALNNMIAAELTDVQFVAVNTDMQALASSKAEYRIQLGSRLTEGLGAGAKPEVGEAAAEEAIEEIGARIFGAHMVFIAAGMGGGTGTGAAHVVARVAKDLGVLAVAVVTRPFHFEGSVRMRNAEAGIAALRKHVDTLLVIPNENLFRVSTHKTTIAEAFLMADEILYSGLACIIDLILKEGLIDLDFADIKTVLSGMGTAMMGMGEASGEQRAIAATEGAIFNPLIDDVSLKGAKNLLLSISGGRDLTLWEVDEAANRVRQEVDPNANIIVGATLDEGLGERIRVAMVASGMPWSGAAERTGEAEGLDWTPRLQRALGSPSAENLGRRLAEAIGERTQKGKARTSKKTGGLDAPAPADAAASTEEQSTPSAEQPALTRARRSPGSRRSAPSDAPVQKSAEKTRRTEGGRRGSRKSLVEDVAAAGRPDYWAAQIAGAGGRAPGAEPPAVGQPADEIVAREAYACGDGQAHRAPETVAMAETRQQDMRGPAGEENGAMERSEDWARTRGTRERGLELPGPSTRGAETAPEETDRREDAKLRYMGQAFVPVESKRADFRLPAAESFAAARQPGMAAKTGQIDASLRGPGPLVAFQHQAEPGQRETNLLQRLAGLVRTRREA